MPPPRHPCEDVRCGSPANGVVDAMSPCERHLLRHPYARLRPSRIVTVSDSLSFASDAEPGLRAMTVNADPSLLGPVAPTAPPSEPFSTFIAGRITTGNVSVGAPMQPSGATLPHDKCYRPRSAGSGPWRSIPDGLNEAPLHPPSSPHVSKPPEVIIYSERPTSIPDNGTTASLRNITPCSTRARFDHNVMQVMSSSPYTRSGDELDVHTPIMSSVSSYGITNSGDIPMRKTKLAITIALLTVTSLYMFSASAQSSGSHQASSAIHNIAVPNTGNIFGTVELGRLGGERATIWNDAQEGRRYYYLPSLLPEWTKFSNDIENSCALADEDNHATVGLRIHLSDKFYENEIRKKIADLNNLDTFHENMLSAIPYDNIQIVLATDPDTTSRLIYDARGRSRMSSGESVQPIPLLSYPREIEATITDTCNTLRTFVTSAKAGKGLLKGRIYFQGVTYRTTSFSIQLNKFLNSERSIDLFGEETLVRRMSFTNRMGFKPDKLGEKLFMRLPLNPGVTYKGEAEASRQRLLSRDLLDYASSQSFTGIVGGCIESSATSKRCSELQTRFVTFLIDHAKNVELTFRKLENGSVELMKNQIAYATLEPSDYQTIADAAPNIDANVDGLQFVVSDKIKWDLSDSGPTPTSVELLLLDEDRLRSENYVEWYEKTPVDDGSWQYMADLAYFGLRIADGMIIPYDQYVAMVNLRNSCRAGGSIVRMGARNFKSGNGVRNDQPVGTSRDYRTITHKHRHRNCGIYFGGEWSASPGHFLLDQIGVTPISVEHTWAAGGWWFEVNKTAHERNVSRQDGTAQMLQSISYNGRAKRGHSMVKKLTCGAVLKFNLQQYPVDCAPFLIEGFGTAEGG